MDFWARRPILRNLGGAGLVVVLWLPLAFLLRSIAPEGNAGLNWEKIAAYIALLAAVLAVTIRYDRMPAAWAGLGLHPWTLREFLLGLMLGGVMILVAWIPIALMAGVRFEGVDAPLLFAEYTLYIVLSAAGEELLFRGYLFQRLMEIVGATAAALLGAFFFAAAHMWNPSLSLTGVLNLFLAGLLFAGAYLRTGSLWMPIGIHIAWNFVTAKIIGLPLSGVERGSSVLRTGLTGPDVITGGWFGPEGGLIGTVALLLGGLLLFRLPSVTYSPYVYAVTFSAFRRRSE